MISAGQKSNHEKITTVRLGEYNDKLETIKDILNDIGKPTDTSTIIRMGIMMLYSNLTRR
jgi:hypothetical protein